MHPEEECCQAGGYKDLFRDEFQVDSPLVLEDARELKGPGEVAPGVGGEEGQGEDDLQPAAEEDGLQKLRWRRDLRRGISSDETHGLPADIRRGGGAKQWNCNVETPCEVGWIWFVFKEREEKKCSNYASDSCAWT